MSKKKKSKKYDPNKETEKSRQDRIDQGFFDGRFSPKSIPNKKRKKKEKYKPNYKESQD